MKSKELITHLFEACKDGRSVSQLHSQILKNGLISNSLFVTKLNSIYTKYSSLELARKLFDETPDRTVYLWNSILRSHCREKQWEVTLHLFNNMLSTTSTMSDKPDNFTVPIAIKACAGLLALRTGKTIHGLVKKNDKINSDMFVGSALVELYAKCGEMGDALGVFEEFPEPDVVLWTSMITGYQQNGNAEKALSFFSRMVMDEGLTPDRVTLVSVVSSCAQLMNLGAGKCVHGFTIKMGFDTDLSLVNSFLNLYAKTGSIRNARNLFEKMYEKDVISWSSMISCYAQNQKPDEALSLFNQMVEKRYDPNSVTLVSVLQACAAAGNVDEGRRIHELAKRKGCELDVSVSTALVDMYMKCSCIEKAVDLFKRMPQKDVVCWGAFISGYAQNGLANESLGIFRSMLSDGTRPDAVIMVKVLKACAELGILHQALCLHCYLVSSGFDDKVFVGAALIDLYSKCGNLENSIRVFEGMNQRDVVVWSSMIAGYGIHGFGSEAIRTFNRMIESSRVIPNDITFLSILSACSHTGLVEEGFKIFDEMVHKYQIEPTSEHYSVMVDLLGRTGKLDKAMEFISQKQVPSGAHVWGALLGACRIHQNVEMAEAVAKKLFRLDPDHAGYYVLLSNIYAVDGKWDSVAKIRNLVKEKGLKRTPGQSLIEVKSRLHTFSAADSSHPEFECISWLLRELEVKMREEGYVPDVDFMLHDV
ncbi:Pentatricopeptide repeat [Macleaya cordata]|uniref:Pentatricopeptide repeat n=1 Tax=Macleaya cordata TaxID=56857 RepID=A0A200RDN1_MACCD|nr:Pentatricopeptide repeat [Macleaya cordata]